MKSLQSVAVQVVDDGLDSLHRSDAIHQVAVLGELVWVPLVDVQILLIGIRVLDEMHAHIVEALDGAHAGGAHGDDLALVMDELLQAAAMYHDILRMHLVTLYLQALHWLEGACAHMERYLLTVYAMSIQS